MDSRAPSPSSTSSYLSHVTAQREDPPPLHRRADRRAMSSASPDISTPPTSLDDAASIRSDMMKAEAQGEGEPQVLSEAAPGLPVSVSVSAPAPPGSSTPEAEQSPESRRPARSSRRSVTTYNVQILAGTAIHTPTKYLEKHHKNVLHGALEDALPQERITPVKKEPVRAKQAAIVNIADPVERQLAAETADAARRRTSGRVTDLRKEALRNLRSGASSAAASPVAEDNGKSRGAVARRSMKSLVASQKRTQQTIDVDNEDADSEAEEKEYVMPKTKAWLQEGLYVGQYREFDARFSETHNRNKRRSRKATENKVLPLPLFATERVLNEDPRHVFKDFKLPFDTYNPLPKKVKVDGWVKLGRNRFIGEASALWRREKQDASQCYCDPEDGCGETCHNRIMAYECDSTNCPLSSEQCRNRPFAELKRRGKGNRYDYGVEVTDTEDRGYGVRAMRSFEPHQIIVEYAGEIITQVECERRMKQIYKKDKCYYLMSFDNKMIIDATRGTIARFVNHSCEPNCEMIKWTVGGEPRMALFAGKRGVMTGEELTYDYNFDPFSQKNIQQCRCGTRNCRGVLGPKPKKPLEDKSPSFPVSIASGIKRKFEQIFEPRRIASNGEASSAPTSKKRKMLTTTTTTTTMVAATSSSAQTKARNALSATEAARARMAREEAEHSRQIADRQNRAQKRSKPIAIGKRGRAIVARKVGRGVVRPVRGGAGVKKVGGLKSVSMRKGLRGSAPYSASATSPAYPSSTRDAVSAKKAGKLTSPTAAKNAKQNTLRTAPPSTPARTNRISIPDIQSEHVSDVNTDTGESEEEEDEVNITPASLRSASRKFDAASVSTSPANKRENPYARVRVPQVGAAKASRSVRPAESGKMDEGARDKANATAKGKEKVAPRMKAGVKAKVMQKGVSVLSRVKGAARIGKR